jgi:uncharacterized small protein (DUF1192 family)
MVHEDEEIFGAPPRKRAPSHEIGQSVDELSTQEIAERIAILQAEIARLESARKAKEASRSAADTFFSPGRPR